MAGSPILVTDIGIVDTGPSYCFTGLTIPPSAPISRVTLSLDAASGWMTPSLTDHPNAKCIGYSTDGWVFGANTSAGASLSVDELDTPIRKSPSTSTPEATAKLVSLLTPGLLELFGFTMRSVDADPYKHYEELSDATLADLSVLWLWRKPKAADPTQYVYRYMRFFKCNMTSKFGGTLKKSELFSVESKFELLAHLGRKRDIYIEEG